MLPTTSENYWASHQRRTFGWQCDSTNAKSSLSSILLFPETSLQRRKYTIEPIFEQTFSFTLEHAFSCKGIHTLYSSRMRPQKYIHTDSIYSCNTVTKEITLQRACSWLNNTSVCTWFFRRSHLGAFSSSFCFSVISFSSVLQLEHSFLSECNSSLQSLSFYWLLTALFCKNEHIKYQ